MPSSGLNIFNQDKMIRRTLKTGPILLPVLLMSCKESSESRTNKPQETAIEIVETDTLNLPAEEIGRPTDSLTAYFNNPVDFYALKKATTHMHSGGNLKIKNDFFHEVDDDRCIYYDYWAIQLDSMNLGERSLSFKVLKPWTEGTKEKYYDTDNEILVGIKSKVAWKALQNSNFVSQSILQIKEKLGEPDTSLNSCLIYHLNEQLIIFKIDEEKVIWFKYIWMRTNLASINDLPDQLFEW